MDGEAPRCGASFSAAIRPDGAYTRAVNPREERQARNEALMREVNEHVVALSRHPGWADANAPMELHCECGAFPACEARIRMTASDYERVREQDDRFAVHPGHENLELESVVERADGWLIVDKLPEFEPLVADDPRGRPSDDA